MHGVMMSGSLLVSARIYLFQCPEDALGDPYRMQNGIKNGIRLILNAVIRVSEHDVFARIFCDYPQKIVVK